MDRLALAKRVSWLLLHVAILAASARHVAAPLVDRDELVWSDFTVYYTGWSLTLADPARVYDAEAQRQTQQALMRPHQFKGGLMAFYYPPHATVALAPFALLGFESAFRLWTAIQLAVAAVLLAWLIRLSKLERGLDRLVLATAVLAFLPFLYTLQIGQLSILMTVAMIGLWRSFDGGRDRLAGAWLALLTVKPHLLIAPLLLVVAARRWRVLVWAAIWTAPFVLAATIVLGPRVWPEYPGNVRILENIVGGGSHDYMLNLRGLVTRLVGHDHERAVLGGCALALAGASAVAYLWLRRAARDGRAPAVAFAGALALALPLALHLQLQDALLWVVPLALFGGELRLRADEPGRRAVAAFDAFALAWPSVYFATRLTEATTGRLLPLPPTFLLAAALVVWIARALSVTRRAV